MPQQLILPMIPRGATEINDRVCVWRGEDRWTYFLGTYPIYSHGANDQRMFRLVTSQLIDSGACRQVEMLSTFGVSKSSVIRSLRRLRSGGPESFFKPRPGRHGGNVLTSEVLENAQRLLQQGHSRVEIASELGVPYDTLRKAISDGRLLEPEREEEKNTTKSSRDVTDARAADGMGTACTRVEERTLAAFGVCDGAPVRFEPCLDVTKGGVLCALPPLLMNGLLEGAEQLLGKVKGYYRCFHILILLAFMALCRIKTVEQLRGHAPGELGKILGLDRVAEVRCLRRKMDELSADNAAEQWAAHLGRHWMQADAEAVGTLYIDGHVRVYHGTQTKLPRRYVSRERLCLRGTTDYWVNDAIGRPFFMVEKVVDPGLLKTLRDDIVPRLLNDIPGQPSQEELADNPHLCRFVLVFDREGYSPAFFREMWKNHRIGCISYHKHPDEPWPKDWFAEHEVSMPNGETVTMDLAEMGSLVGTGKDALWMREVRRLKGSFAAIEHRFLRDGFWQSLSHQELLLYFFLVLVGDRFGVSFYSYDRIITLLHLRLDEYIQARDALIAKDLIAFDGHLFQVLSLPEAPLFPPVRLLKTPEDMLEKDPATIHRTICEALGKDPDESLPY